MSFAKTALVADDDEPHRSTMRRLPEGDGYQVVEARDGEEALTWSCPHWVDTSS